MVHLVAASILLLFIILAVVVWCISVQIRALPGRQRYIVRERPSVVAQEQEAAIERLEQGQEELKKEIQELKSHEGEIIRLLSDLAAQAATGDQNSQDDQMSMPLRRR